MRLTVEATIGGDFSIEATGRDAELCGTLEENLILETYRDVLKRASSEVRPLHIQLHNEIPLGMGCGSSAAALLAGVALANHFGGPDSGGLGMSSDEIVAEASRIEGHPDNVAACWYGGFTVSCQDGAAVQALTFAADMEGTGRWKMLLAVQTSSLATKKARALLPDSYSKADTIFNVQRTSLLVAAFAQGRLDFLKAATNDRMHQPYREAACPLLRKLLPLTQEREIAGVVLSGAGPSVLVFLAEETTPLEGETRVRSVLEDEVELLHVRIGGGVELRRF